ncbi:MAG: hypothetical protein M1836_006104 [Candelina mexicana]|nr:MAG: hypothetical protein M1836_006104 [Candelina mexicana]
MLVMAVTILREGIIITQKAGILQDGTVVMMPLGLDTIGMAIMVRSVMVIDMATGLTIIAADMVTPARPTVDTTPVNTIMGILRIRMGDTTVGHVDTNILRILTATMVADITDTDILRIHMGDSTIGHVGTNTPRIITAIMAAVIMDTDLMRIHTDHGVMMITGSALSRGLTVHIMVAIASQTMEGYHPQNDNDFAPGPSRRREHPAHGRHGGRRPGDPFGDHHRRPASDSDSGHGYPFDGARGFYGGHGPYGGRRRGTYGRNRSDVPPFGDDGMLDFEPPEPEEPKPNFYEVLEVPETATAEECAKAGKKKLVKVHPDRHPEDRDDPEKLKHWTDEAAKVTEAQDTLGDEAKKAKYDRQLRRRRLLGIF